MPGVWDVDPVLYFLAGSALLKYSLLALWHRKRPRNAEYVGEVAELRLHPLKSAAYIAVQRVHCTYPGLQSGIIRDRHWMIIDSEGISVNSKTHPVSAVIRPSFHGNFLHLDAPGISEVLKVDLQAVEDEGRITDAHIHGVDTKGLDCGDEANKWLAKVFSHPVEQYRLLYSPRGFVKRRINANKNWADWLKVAKDEDEMAFADSSSGNLLAEESVADLNTRLGSPVNMDHFRPNIVTRGSKAYDEDTWKDIYIGDVKFFTIKLCGRCPAITVNPETGLRDPDQQPLKTLRSYRRIVPDYGQSPCLGTNLVVDWEGTIQVGDPIYVVRGDNVKKPM